MTHQTYYDEKQRHVRALCQRDAAFAQGYAVMGDDGVAVCLDTAGIARSGGWDHARVQARLGETDALAWFCCTTYLEYRGWLSWGYYGSPNPASADDSWRDRWALDGYLAEGFVMPAGVLYLFKQAHP
jgi:hypothetical protein